MNAVESTLPSFEKLQLGDGTLSCSDEVAFLGKEEIEGEEEEGEVEEGEEEDEEEGEEEGEEEE